MILGIDCSHWQQPPLPWAAWVAGGLQVACIQITHGTILEQSGYIHFNQALAAGVDCLGAYHFLLDKGARECQLFLSQFHPAYKFAALDIEAPGLTAQMVVDWCDYYDAHETRPLYLYGNNALAAILTAQRALRRYRIWWAAYPLGTQRISRPPTFTVGVNVPRGTNLSAWQFTGTGILPPYTGNIDLSVWYELPGAKPMPIITHGPKLGLHSIQPGNTLALVQKALDHGWHWPVVKILHDASVAVDVKARSPQTLTIVRYMPPSVDDEGLQGVENWGGWEQQQWAKRLIDNCMARTNPAHLPAVDYFDLTNEPGAHGVLYYQKLGQAFRELVEAADKAHIHLSLPALPQGVPEWEEMQALVSTGLFGLMKAGGHIWDCHEGTFTDQPVDFGFGDVIPGAPPVLGAGSTNFRHRYLYSLLEQRNEVVPLVISEFYGGGRYSDPAVSQLARFAWYDQRARQEPYLLAFLPFTINSDATWAAADYGPTYASPELWAYIDAEKSKPNGDTNMADITAARAAIAAAQAQLTAAVAALAEHWWDALPNGPLTPARKTHPNSTTLPLYSSAAANVAYALRTVDPANYVIDVYARSGSRLQVTNNPSNLVWVDAANVVAFS